MEIVSGAGKASINPVASANIQGNTRSAVQALPADGCWCVICTLNKSAKMNLTDGGGCGNSLNWERLSVGFLEVAVTGNLTVVRWQDLPLPC